MQWALGGMGCSLVALLRLRRNPNDAAPAKKLEEMVFVSGGKPHFVIEVKGSASISLQKDCPCNFANERAWSRLKFARLFPLGPRLILDIHAGIVVVVGISVGSTSGG